MRLVGGTRLRTQRLPSASSAQLWTNRYSKSYASAPGSRLLRPVVDKTEYFKDDYQRANGNPGTNYVNTGLANIVSGQLVFTGDPSYGGTNGDVVIGKSLVGSFIMWNVAADTASGSDGWYLQVVSPLNYDNTVYIYFDMPSNTANLNYRNVPAGDTAVGSAWAWSRAATPWVRIAMLDGVNITADTSADGVNWTNRATFAATLLTWSREFVVPGGGGGVNFTIDNLNIIPVIQTVDVGGVSMTMTPGGVDVSNVAGSPQNVDVGGCLSVFTPGGVDKTLGGVNLSVGGVASTVTPGGVDKTLGPFALSVGGVSMIASPGGVDKTLGPVSISVGGALSPTFAGGVDFGAAPPPLSRKDKTMDLRRKKRRIWLNPTR